MTVGKSCEEVVFSFLTPQGVLGDRSTSWQCNDETCFHSKLIPTYMFAKGTVVLPTHYPSIKWLTNISVCVHKDCNAVEAFWKVV